MRTYSAILTTAPQPKCWTRLFGQIKYFANNNFNYYVVNILRLFSISHLTPSKGQTDTTDMS